MACFPSFIPGVWPWGLVIVKIKLTSVFYVCPLIDDKFSRILLTKLRTFLIQTSWDIFLYLACVAWRFKLFFEREWSGEAVVSLSGISRLWGLLSRFPRLKTAKLRRLSLSYLIKIWFSEWRHHLANLHILKKTWISLERKEVFVYTKQHFSSHTDYLFMFWNGLGRKDAIFVIVPLCVFV